MKKNHIKIIKTYIGFGLLAIMIIAHLIHALDYYGIREMKLPEFYLWQAK